MITFATEADAQLYEAIGQLAARACDLGTVDIVAQFKSRLVDAAERARSADRDRGYDSGSDPGE